MNTNEIIVSKGTIKIDNSDESSVELSFAMPKEIMEKILCEIIEWKDNWIATTNTVEKYQENEKDFLLRISNQSPKK